MRAAVLILLALLAAPAMARDLGWAPYENTRFGYTIDIPPNFTGRGESDNGDGQIYVRRDRGQGLTVWGGHVLEDFETSAIEAMQLTQRDRWNASYQAITPGWAVLQAANGLRRLHLRLVATCDSPNMQPSRSPIRWPTSTMSSR